MEYRVYMTSDSISIKVMGPFNKNAIYSAGQFMKSLLNGAPARVTLDIDDLQDEREMIFHMGLVNAFKKEIDRAGGKLLVKTEKQSLRRYLRNTGMDRIFDTGNGQLMN